MAQLVSIEQDWMSPRFHCPVCGAEIYSESGEPTSTPCEHLLFSWINEVGEFDNLADGIRQVVEGAEDEWFVPWEEESFKKLPESAVVFSLTAHGMACGPVSTTICHAVRFPADFDEQ